MDLAEAAGANPWNHGGAGKRLTAEQFEGVCQANPNAVLELATACC
jgi:hypothetical protein